MNLSTASSHLQGFPPAQPGSLRACGGYFQPNFDTVFGEYTPWSTGEGGSKQTEFDKSLNAGSSLNQSAASLTLDDLVSGIIGDDSLSQSQEFSSHELRNQELSSYEDVWRNDVFDSAFISDYNVTKPDNLAHSLFHHDDMGQDMRLEGRKLVGRQENRGSTSTRSSDSAFELSTEYENNMASPWSTDSPKASVNQMWSNKVDTKTPDVWNQRPTDLFIDTGQQWSNQRSNRDFQTSRSMRDGQLLQANTSRSPESVSHGQSPLTGLTAGEQQAAFYYRQQQHTMSQHRGDGSPVYPGMRQMSVPVSAAVRSSAASQKHSPVSPMAPIGSPVQQMMSVPMGRGGPSSQLQRQALHQHQLKYGMLASGAMERGEQNSPHSAYSNHMARSPMSDTSSLGSPAGRAPDSPMSLYGRQSGSPLLHSPQTGAIPITSHQQRTYSEYLSPNPALAKDTYIAPMVPAIFYGPRGELYYDMIQLPQQASRLHGPQQQQYQHRPPRRTGPANDLHIKLEEAYDQFKNMEKERKKFEGEMARQNTGKKVSSANNVILPTLPTNPSRVDRLIIDSLKEHAKVITLLDKMESLNEKEFHSNIHSAMEGWLDSIRKVQARRKEEIINATNRHRSGAPRNHDERDVIALAAAIAELSQTCRRARTALWCALQISWKPGFIPLGVMSKRAEIVAREKEALKEQQQLLAAQAVAANRSASASTSASSVAAGQSLSSSSVASSMVAGSLSGVSLLPDSPLAHSPAFSLFPPADPNNNALPSQKI